MTTENPDECCYSGLNMNTNGMDAELLKEARMHDYNKDLRNIAICLKVVETQFGKPQADKLRTEAVELIQTGNIARL